MEKLHAVHRDERFDLIVLDTPPTANALDFLEAPQRLVGAIDSPVMRWFVDTLKTGAGLSLLGKSASFVLRGLARFTGTAFLDLVAEFIVELNTLFGGFRERAQAVYDGLRADDVAFVVVTSPNPATIAEAVFFGDRLGQYGITPKGVVVNRVHPPVPELLDDSSLHQAIVETAGNGHTGPLEAAVHSAAADARAWALRDQEGIRRLQGRLGDDMRYVEVPALEQDVHDLASLSRVADYLA